MLVCGLPSAALILINATLLHEMKFLSAIISFILSILTFPVTSLGISYVLLRIWSGENLKLSMLFRYYNHNEIFTALLTGFIYSSAMRLSSIPYYISQLFPVDSVAAVIFSRICVGFILISFWVEYRLTLLPYLYCIEFSRKPFELIGESFRRMKGKAGSYIGLSIIVTWWRILVSFAVSILLGIVAVNKGLFLGSHRNIVFNAIFVIGYIILMVLMPYPALSFTGFAKNVISSEKAYRKSVKKEYNIH